MQKIFVNKQTQAKVDRYSKKSLIKHTHLHTYELYRVQTDTFIA